MKSTLTIADLKCRLPNHFLSHSEHLKAFKTNGIRAEMTIKPLPINTLTKPLPETLIVRDEWPWSDGVESLEWYDSGETYTVVFYKNQHLGGVMRLSKDYSQCEIYSNADLGCSDYSIIEAFISIQFRNKIIHHDGFIFHASGLKINNKAILFSGSSGTGKSTHSAHWIQALQAEVFNGDTPAIRYESDQIFAYGTPWCGTSKQYLAMKVPLGAIVILEQSPTNSLTRLDHSNAVEHLLPRVLLPYHDSELMTKAMDHLTTIIMKTPIFLLKCTAGPESFDVAKSILEQI